MRRPESWRGISGELVYEVARVAPDTAPLFEHGASFVDGNKRAGFLAVDIFLAINGQRLTAKLIDAIEAVMSLSAGRMGASPGHIVYAGTFTSVAGINSVPKNVATRVLERFPTYVTAPEEWVDPSFSSLENYARTQTPAKPK